MPMRGVSVALCMALAGCTTPSRDELIARIAPTTVHVVSSREVTGFHGDLAEIWYSHLVEEPGASGRRYIVMGDRNDCPIASADPAALYSVRIGRQRRAYGVGGDVDESMLSPLVIFTCEPISPVSG